MAITSAFCNSFKTDLFSSNLALGTDVIKLAFYTSAATLSKSTTAYSATNEVGNSGSYTAGGISMSGITVALSTDTGYIDWTVDPAATTATITARGCLIYDSTVAGKNAMGTFDFGADYTSTAGTFTVTLPAAGATATFRLA